MMHVDKGRWAILPLILYKVSLDLSYYLIVPIGGYYAVSTVELNALKLIESYILFFLLIAVAPKDTNTLGRLLFWLLIVFSYVPMLTIYALTNESRLFMYATTCFWCTVAYFYRRGRPLFLKAPRQALGRKVNLRMFVGLIALALLTVIATRGFQFLYDIRQQLPGQMSDVYDIRTDFVDLGLPLHGYWFHWLACVFNPIFFAICVLRKKWVYVGLIVYLQLLVSLMVGARTYFLTLPFVLGLMWIVSRKHPLSILSAGLTAIIILSALYSYLLYNSFPYNILVGRLLSVPAELSFYYYDFFSSHHHLHLSYIFNDLLKIHSLVRDPYGASPDLLIGETYFGQQDLAAVSGIVADGYMNFGILGVAVWAMLLATILGVLDGVSKGVDQRVGAAALAIPALSFSGTFLVRTLFTAGFILTLVVLYFLPRKDLSMNTAAKALRKSRKRRPKLLLPRPAN
jgi:hypothetical protein